MGHALRSRRRRSIAGNRLALMPRIRRRSGGVLQIAAVRTRRSQRECSELKQTRVAYFLLALHGRCRRPARPDLGIHALIERWIPLSAHDQPHEVSRLRRSLNWRLHRFYSVANTIIASAPTPYRPRGTSGSLISKSLYLLARRTAAWRAPATSKLNALEVAVAASEAAFAVVVSRAEARNAFGRANAAQACSSAGDHFSCAREPIAALLLRRAHLMSPRDRALNGSRLYWRSHK